MKKSTLVLFTVFGFNALVAQINNPADMNNPNSSFGQTTPSTQNQTGVGTNALDLNLPTGTETTPLNTTPGLNSTTGTENPVGNTPTNTNTTPPTQNSNGNNPTGINSGVPNSTFPQNTPPRK
jgi:hypothetical protein